MLWAQVKNRTESHRPRATRFKAPPHHRGAGHPARGDTDRRQPQRRDSTPGAGRGYSTHLRQERTISWLHNFRRLRIRFEQLAFIHEAFLKIACCIICWRRLKTSLETPLRACQPLSMRLQGF
ncbi:transposase [Caballeronia jiangsuensis]|nr:transposase [Caballeronia jiangsuensis]